MARIPARRWFVGVGIAMSLASAASATELRANAAEFGRLADGTAVPAVTLTNSKGMRVRIIALGAAIQSLEVPDRNGKVADVVLGYDTAAGYLAKPQYFGVSVGRYANRIAKGKFKLDGREYTLETNDGPNHLHGGAKGFDKVVWKIDSVAQSPDARVVLSYVSPDGAGGYPGTLTARVTYSLNERNELTAEYRATTDKPTIVNLTNHAYFNLTGNLTGNVVDGIYGHKLTLFADEYTPVDATLIPTGERRKVSGTPFDFTTGETIGARVRDGRDEQMRAGRGYDHNYILRGTAGQLRPAARVEDPSSGRVLELLATAAGVQFYSGNFLDGTSVGKGGRIYRQGDGLCLEPQVFPDTPNQPAFGSARLDPGREYVNTMTYRFSVTAR
jgi:aldose 1-epimerase